MSDKLQSRKFMVWIIWLTITIIVAAMAVISMIVMKQVPDNLVELFEKVLGWFFGITMMYLGVNVVQKGAFAIADVFANKKEEPDEDTNLN